MIEDEHSNEVMEQDQEDDSAVEKMDADVKEEVIDDEPDVPENDEDDGDEKDEKGEEEETEVKEEEEEEEEKEVVVPKHPYESELENLEPNSWQTEKHDPQKPGAIEEGTFTLVDTEALLEEMVAKLKEVKELAVDVEHHSYRSYRGLVCLIQISTRSEDFVIDSIELKEQLDILNGVFTDSSIIKVLHGGDRDITWLQRDFGVYIVNMFDTQRAARVLKEEVINLARLLNKYCDVTVNKTFQIADWRTRPLPEDMITYARQDTHYLLYLYDLYRNLLLERGDDTNNLMNDVYKQSTEICRQVYVFQPDTYMRAYRKCKGHLNKRQLECFRLLHGWRNKIASSEDESTGYTLPNKMMFNVARVLPRDEKALISCCKPMPPLVQLYIDDVRKFVEQAIKNVPNYVADMEAGKGVKTKKPLSKKDREHAIKLKKKIKISKKQWCLECGKRGHWAKDCAEKRGQPGPQFLMKVGGRGAPYGGAVGGPRGASNFRGRGYQTQPFGMAPAAYGNTRPQGYFRGGIHPGMSQQSYGGGMNPYGAGMNGPQYQPSAAMNSYNMGPRGASRMNQQRASYNPYYQW